ncbi:MAG: S8 family serine peptidase [Candidatus Sericytochromatia bacterium]
MKSKSLTHLLVIAVLSSGLAACGGANSNFTAAQQSNFSSLQGQQAVPNEYLIKRSGVAYLETPEVFAQKNGLLFVEEIQDLGVELFQANDPAAIDKLQGQVEFAEPNYLRSITLPQQSGVQAQSVYHRQSTSESVPTAINNYIGLIDTGVDISHPDLQGKLLAGHNTLGGADVADENGHGTYLAGVAVAANSQQQISGVTPGGKILPIKALDANGIGTDFSIAKGIMKAVEYGAKVIVLSASAPQQGKALTAAIDYANRMSVPIVAPAGNGLAAASFPGNYRGVLAINSIDSTGQRPATFAAQSANVTISAVAQGIRSTLPMRSFSLNRMGLTAGYGQLESPGIAAMQAAAALALIRTRQPQLNLPQMKQALVQSADNMGQNPALGSGRLNIARVSRGNAVTSQSYGRAPAQTAYAQQPAYGYATAPAAYTGYANQQPVAQYGTYAQQPRRAY